MEPRRRIGSGRAMWSPACSRRWSLNDRPGAAAVIPLALDVDGRITRITRNGCVLLGWTEPELLGRDWIATCLPARVADAPTRTYHQLIGRDISVVESVVLTRSGEERLIE